MTDLEEVVARAMKKFIETPLPNNTEPPSIIDLTRVLAGCLGDVWKDIAIAALTAIEAEGRWKIVPVEPTKEMLRAVEREPLMPPMPRSTWAAALSASPKVTG